MLLKHINKRSMLLALSIVIIDLIVKSIILKNIPDGQYIKTLGGLITLAKIQNYKMTLGNHVGQKVLTAVVILFQLAFTYFAFLVQRSEAGKLFKYASILIAGGWLGNLLDKMLFSHGSAGYVSLDYLNVAGTSFFFNLSGFMTLTGWLLLMFAIAANFKEFMSFFKARKYVK